MAHRAEDLMKRVMVDHHKPASLDDTKVRIPLGTDKYVTLEHQLSPHNAQLEVDIDDLLEEEAGPDAKLFYEGVEAGIDKLKQMASEGFSTFAERHAQPGRTLESRLGEYAEAICQLAVLMARTIDFHSHCPLHKDNLEKWIQKLWYSKARDVIGFLLLTAYQTNQQITRTIVEQVSEHVSAALREACAMDYELLEKYC